MAITAFDRASRKFVVEFLAAALAFASLAATPLEVHAATPPPNDLFAFANLIGALPYADANVNTTLATDEDGEPSPTCFVNNPSQHTVWYRFVAAATTTVSASALPTNLVGNKIAAIVDAFEGTDIHTLGNVGCSTAYNANDPVHLTFPVTVGHTYYIRVGGKGFYASGAFNFTLTNTATPTVSAPTATPKKGATLGTSTIPVVLSWTGQGHGSPIDHYVLQESTDGVWTTLESSVATTSAAAEVAAGHAYAFRVKAIDTAGRVSAWATSALIHPVTYQETSRAIAYVKTWKWVTAASAFGGHLKYAMTAGASATLTFTGSSVAWIAGRGPNNGVAKIYVDGVYVGPVDLFAAVATSRRIVFTKAWSTSGARTLRIVVVGTAGHPRIDIDALVILG